MAFQRRSSVRIGNGPSLLTVIYLVIGVVVAVNHHYDKGALHHIDAFINFVLATVLWPLVLLGTHFTVHVG